MGVYVYYIQYKRRLIMLFGTISWSSLLVVSALGILGLWVAYSFLNKNGLYIFSILAIVLSTYLTPALIHGPISMAIVFMPLVFFALLICYEKYGKDEAKKMFYISLITIGVLFVFTFFQAAYLDAEFGAQFFLSWNYLGIYISLAVSYAAAVFGTFYLKDKITWKKMSKFLRRGIIVSIASTINCLLFVILTSIGVLSFGSIILVFLIALIITVLVSFAVSYLSKYTNHKIVIEVAPESLEKENKEIDSTEKATEPLTEEDKEKDKE